MRTIGTLAVAALVASVLSACSPLGLGDGGFNSGASARFPTAVSGPDARAQGLLATAWSNVLLNTTTGERLGEITPHEIAGADPTLSLSVVGDVPATVGVISVDHAGSDAIVMSTKSASGTFLCIAVTNTSIPTTGSVDAVHATSAHDCTGKAWGPS